MPQQLSFAKVNPWLGAVLFGFLSGSALLALFRHGASLGGVGIVALMLQDRTGLRAGWVQLGFDGSPGGAAEDRRHQLPRCRGGEPGHRNQPPPRPLVFAA